MPAGPSLQVAMVVESSVVPAWIAALAARLGAAPTIDLGIFRLPATQQRPRRPTLVRLYERLDARLFRCFPEAFDPVSIDVVSSPARGFQGRDVVLDFTANGPEELAEGVAYGVWGLSHGLTDSPNRTPLYVTQIDAHFDDGTRVLVYRSYGAVDPASLHRTRNHALWKAQGAFEHRLETVRRLGRSYVDSRPRSTPTANPSQSASPSSRVVVRHAAESAFGVIGRRLRMIREREAWVIAARPRRQAPSSGPDSGSTEGFAPIEWSSQAAIADPFVIEEGGDTYVFFEDDPGTGNAHISYIRLDADGRPTTPPARALAAPYHLSYPFVFRHEGEIFMIPESSANGTVELYRAAPFPSAWTLEHVLLQGIHAFDATLLATDARLWLFATVAQEGAAPNDELHLYSSTALTGPWEPHAANPVVSDVRSARPAGRIFERDGDLIRPSQDCSRRYGYALVFNRIDVLTDDEYRETPVGRIEPDWFPGLVATHTYNFGADVEVIDGKRVVPRPAFARFLR